MTAETTTTYAFKIKCRPCGLHYTVYSWKEGWPEGRSTFCPECGVKDSKIIWGPEELSEFIFEQVPGRTEMTQMT